MRNSNISPFEILIIALLIAGLALLLTTPVSAEEQHQKMWLTCYCPESCPGTITYSGEPVRLGIAAVAEEHIGKGALVYTLDGEFIGYYECLDKIGTGKSTVIDIWQPNLFRAREMMKKTEGRVKVRWVERRKMAESLPQ